MGGIVDEAARVPRPGQSKVYAASLGAATSQTYSVPAGWKNHWVTFVMTGDEARIAFSTGAAAPLVLNTNSGSVGDPAVLTPAAATGWPLIAGQPQAFMVGPDDSTFEIVAGATGGTWFAYLSGGLGE